MQGAESCFGAFILMHGLQEAIRLCISLSCIYLVKEVSFENDADITAMGGVG